MQGGTRVLIAIPFAEVHNVFLGEASGGVTDCEQGFVHHSVDRERSSFDIDECEVAVQHLPRVSESGARGNRQEREGFILDPENDRSFEGFYLPSRRCFGVEGLKCRRRRSHRFAVLGHCARWSMDSSHGHPSLHFLEGARESLLRVLRAR